MSSLGGRNGMGYTTYILKSLEYNKTYVGHTADLDKRIKQHNNGNSTYTKRYMPWRVMHTETFIEESESIKKEKYFKTSAGRRWMKKNLFNI